MKLKLFSTEGCHLCEQAFSLLKDAGLDGSVDIIDIAFDDTLFLRYGVTIPVLNFNDNELNWPFDAAGLAQWLTANGITYDS
ncbi:glutaredoxin family protein [Vibrio astriarenae]|jgi:predicted thioredoxin/glutaredoxin|uniref:glutaredoxin family protein n=1 Tax=Vibrio agarivorans TaxID=153622 RepID=UPI002231F67C|nr:glutaredoxin family protein [Vibrio agarivorans]MDN3663315.1 glutaredoxin family protein [Vibrio agarivorans]